MISYSAYVDQGLLHIPQSQNLTINNYKSFGFKELQWRYLRQPVLLVSKSVVIKSFLRQTFRSKNGTLFFR